MFRFEIEEEDEEEEDKEEEEEDGTLLACTLNWRCISGAGVLLLFEAFIKQYIDAISKFTLEYTRRNKLYYFLVNIC